MRQIHRGLDSIVQEADALGIPGRVAVWSGSAGVPFGFVAAPHHSSVRGQVAFFRPMDLRTDESRTAPIILLAIGFMRSHLTEGAVVAGAPSSA